MTTDSYGVEIKPGDIIEAVDCPANSGEKYHVCYQIGCNDPEIRDLGNNNIDVWKLYKEIKNLGHFSLHLDKLCNEDFTYHFDFDLETLKQNGVTSLIINGTEFIKE